MDLELDSRATRFDDDLVERLLAHPETDEFECKRVGDNARKLQTIVAFANTRGGLLVLGIEDQDKARGRDRVHGIQENVESVDELERLLKHRITPLMAPPATHAVRLTEVECTLRGGDRGSIVLVRVERSASVHSLVDGGTYIRMSRSNRQISASEIVELALQRGTHSWVSVICDVPFGLLETTTWRQYAGTRRLTRPIEDSLRNLGLAREDDHGRLRPSRAAVLLFADDPSGLLDHKCSVRLFQYRGENIEHGPDTNLLRPPRTISGPLLNQIRDASSAVLEALATGVQVGPLGFEVAQSYPVRVLREAVTNAVIHRDYRLQADIQVRVFANRVEIESPGLLPANVTAANIATVGSRPRNRSIIDHLREFSQPPNLDAGEGVRMMFETMRRASLYPPLYLTPPDLPRDSVCVVCFNETRPNTWTQVEQYLNGHVDIGNAEVRRLIGTDDPVRASRFLRSWVQLGLLVVTDPDAVKWKRRYRRPGAMFEVDPFAERSRKDVDGSP